jgi:hypothetical protein
MVDSEGRIKLGHSVNPAARSKQMPRAVTVVHETDVIEQAERVERLAHRILALHGTHLRGEWFEASIDDALHAIEIAIRQAEQEELALGGRLDGRADIEISVYTPISVRLSDENRAWLVRKADEEDRSLNNMINRIIEAAREADKRKDRK